MKRLAPCSNCGRIYSITRSDRRVCSPSCSVKFLYASKHNLSTPYEQYEEMITMAELDDDTGNLVPIHAEKKEILLAEKKEILPTEEEKLIIEQAEERIKNIKL